MEDSSWVGEVAVEVDLDDHIEEKPEGSPVERTLDVYSYS